MTKEDTEQSLKYKCCLWTIRIAMNVFVGLVIAGSGVLIWFLLRWEVGIDDPTAGGHTTTMVVPIVVTVIIMVAPVLFSWMTRYEHLSSPR
jgi:phosphotransferase system  glucose/maltose/N-acetylglucosamine-specific IIC component